MASEKKRIKGDSELITKYKDVLRKIDEIEVISGRGRKVTEVELQTLKNLHDDLLKEIKQSDPKYYDNKTARPINMDELLRILNGKTLVEYFLGKKLAIFIVKDGLTVKIIDVDEKVLSNKVLKFRELISKLEDNLNNGINPDKTQESEKAEEILKDFYKLLIEPIKGYLNKEKEIVIIPHSYLHLIPFQALRGDRYLIEDYKLCFAQSASSLKFLKNGNGKGALVVGNPTCDLPFSEIEALKVAELLKTNPISRDDAKKDRIMKEIKNKEILHFSCHGVFDTFNPAFSRIIVSDGSITAIDFMDLDMSANLTVISACDTALTKIAGGDEVEGLVRAIQYGGCRFVIASLWKVADKSTNDLFMKFYIDGAIIDRLRNAELSLMKDYGFYHWASFQVYGI